MAVCSENLSAGVVVVKSAKDGVLRSKDVKLGALNPLRPSVEHGSFEH
jgi:hypothetical protein